MRPQDCSAEKDIEGEIKEPFVSLHQRWVEVNGRVFRYLLPTAGGEKGDEENALNGSWKRLQKEGRSCVRPKRSGVVSILEGFFER